MYRWANGNGGRMDPSTCVIRCRETPIASASCFWVSPTRTRSALRSRPVGAWILIAPTLYPGAIAAKGTAYLPGQDVRNTRRAMRFTACRTVSTGSASKLGGRSAAAIPAKVSRRATCR